MSEAQSRSPRRDNRPADRTRHGLRFFKSMEDYRPNNELEAALADLVSDQTHDVNQLLPLVYQRLHNMARHQLAAEDPGHTLQPTALVHEAYLRLASQHTTTWKSESHFLAVAATAMRRILIDHARGRGRAKRGGGHQRISLTDAEPATPDREVDVLALDEAMQQLAKHDAMAARIVEMRFFASMGLDAIAQVLGVTERTVRRHWVYAKAWIAREMLREQALPQSDQGPTGDADSDPTAAP